MEDVKDTEQNNIRKKILIATDNYLPRWDGIARFLSEIIPRIDKEYDITVIAPDFPGDFINNYNIQIIRVPLFKFKIGDFTPPKFNLSLIKKNCREADIIWTQTIGPIGGTAIYYGKRFQKPLIAYTHSLEWELVTKSMKKRRGNFLIYNLTKSLARYLYNKCDLLLTPSVEIAELLSWQRIKANKVVVKMGVDTKRFAPTENKVEKKEKIGIPPMAKVIGFVGRLGREKDPRTLFRAFTRLHKNYPNTALLIIGNGIEELENLFKDKKDIYFIGSTENVIEYYQAMDIYVLPSLTETSSLTTLEAMSCGIAVVVTPVGYIKEYIRDRYNGIFFSKEDPYKLSKTLATLIDDEKFRRRLGLTARKTIMDEFSWEKTVEDIKKVLDSFLKL